MINANLIFCLSEDWQQYMNNDIVIRIGQPVIKADKGSMLLPIEKRCGLVTEARPEVKGFAHAKCNTRLYLPISCEQVALFFQKKGLTTLVSYNINGEVSIKCMKKLEGFELKCLARDWYEASALMFVELRKVGKLK